MKSRFLLPFFLLIAAALLSACSGGYQTTGWPSVHVDDQTAYLASGPHVYAVGLENGLERWRFPEKADMKMQFYAKPAMTPDGQLIVGDYSHILYSLNPETGLENWRFEESQYGYIAGPLVTESAIFAPTNGGQVYALDLKGNLRWRKSLDGQHGIWTQPVMGADCGCIYVASMDHRLYALNAENGEILWVSEGLGGAFVGRPALSEVGVLYAGNFDKKVVSLNAQTGAAAAPAYETDAWVWSGMALVDDRLYFGDQAGNFYVLDTADGLSPLAKVPGTEAIVSTPLVVSDTVYVTTQDGSLLLFDRDGNPQGRQAFAESELPSSPVQADNLILLAPIKLDSLLIAVNAQGLQQWAFVPEKK
ncbi:MAG: PQQ-binding-like beta-propeller repeat protein [Chloroflexota bacterium]